MPFLLFEIIWKANTVVPKDEYLNITAPVKHDVGVLMYNGVELTADRCIWLCLNCQRGVIWVVVDFPHKF